MTWGSALRAVTALLQAKQLRPGPVIARVLELSQALLRAVASLRPSSLHDFSSMTKKDCHFVVAVFLYCLFPCSIRFLGIMHRR